MDNYFAAAQILDVYPRDGFTWLHCRILQGHLKDHQAPFPVHADEATIQETLTRGLAPILGWSCILEFEPRGSSWLLVGLWDRSLARRLATRKAADVMAEDPERVQAALAYINRKRIGIQPPLSLAATTWTSYVPTAEAWTPADIIVEARRLGWRPR